MGDTSEAAGAGTPAMVALPAARARARRRSGHIHRLRYTHDDGWELLRAGDIIAGHDGFDAQEVTAAQQWAATELLDAHGVRVLGWTARMDAGQIEHVVTLAGHEDDPGI